MGILLSELVGRTLADRLSLPFQSRAIAIEFVLIVVAYFMLTRHAAVGLESFVACMSLALGLQNGTSRRTGGISVHTTYLTGMITGPIATEAETLLSSSTLHAKTEVDPKFGMLYGIWGAFVLGAGTGAAMASTSGAFGVLGAALLLFAIMIHNSILGASHEAQR